MARKEPIGRSCPGCARRKTGADGAAPLGPASIQSKLENDLRFSSFVDRIAGEGAEAWKIHDAARQAKARGEDILMLSIGDPDFATPTPICDAAIAAIRAGDTHYTDMAGRERLRDGIVRRHNLLSGLNFDADNVLILSGAQCALFSTALCIAGAGEEVIILDPAYVTYEAVVRASGARLVRVAQPAETGFRPDFAAIEAAITGQTRAMLITNPNNPTGVVMTQAELEGIADIARRHDLWVVSDEVYGDLVFEGRHHAIAGLPGMAERTVTVGSLSKSHAMTGWRVGWAIGPKPLMTHLDNLALAMLYGSPGFIQEAAIAAIDAGESVVADMRDTYRRRRDRAIEALSGVQGLRCAIPQSGMFLMADIRGLGITSSAFAWGLLREQGVSVLDASPFGACAQGHIRMSFTLSEAQTSEACRRIAAYAQALETV